MVFSCGQGYTLTGPATIVCQTDGTWSGPTPSCDVGKVGIVHFNVSLGTWIGGDTHVNVRAVFGSSDFAFMSLKSAIALLLWG